MANFQLIYPLWLLFNFILGAYVTRGSAGTYVPTVSLKTPSSQPAYLSKGDAHLKGRREAAKSYRNIARRLMIGSTAPTCTYNECRGCKYKCRAEQVPVEGNDPINSPYRYRCVCHR